MTDTLPIVAQPAKTAPTDGSFVQLVVTDGKQTWRTPKAFAWNGQRWMTRHGRALPSHLAVTGWDRVEVEANDAG